jgi:hypothetical protein
LNHVEQAGRNNNSRDGKMIGTTLVSALFSKFWKLFWTYLTLQDKHNICVYDRDRMEN